MNAIRYASFWRHSLRVLLGAALAVGCGRDPILDQADEEMAASPGQPGQPGAPGAPQEPPPGVPGVPGEPAPGVPAEPPPGVPGAPGGPEASGPKATLKGEIQPEGWSKGPIRIDVFDGDQRVIGGPRPNVVAVVRLDRPGPYEVQIPATTKQVWIGAYADEDGDGKPGPAEPAGWYGGNPLAVRGDAAGLDIALQKQEPPKSGE